MTTEKHHSSYSSNEIRQKTSIKKQSLRPKSFFRSFDENFPTRKNTTVSRIQTIFLTNVQKY